MEVEKTWCVRQCTRPLTLQLCEALRPWAADAIKLGYNFSCQLTQTFLMRAILVHSSWPVVSSLCTSESNVSKVGTKEYTRNQVFISNTFLIIRCTIIKYRELHNITTLFTSHHDSWNCFKRTSRLLFSGPHASSVTLIIHCTTLVM